MNRENVSFVEINITSDATLLCEGSSYLHGDRQASQVTHRVCRAEGRKIQ